ncbi:class I SAM-dependent DNA methyltransferase [Erythrobacter sp. NE805]|uniref:class I SAM-dependent DNA methyltransferase n=1 Tax=Erythrobacter sp. NE805 TaxID=3389875 RepID=UPI00396B4030
MNPVEIEEAVTQLASEPFDRAEFPFQFLTAFGNKKTTIDRLRKGNTNQSDLSGGVLQRSNIHIATCAPGAVGETLTALRNSPKTATNKAKFILATDGMEFQAEDLSSGETIACDYPDFPDHFGFFLPLAGITTVEQIRESSFDIRATSRLNRLYMTLLQDNPDWAKAERRTDMNHFMARLIFCFFAEDTDIFHPSYRFTATVEKMSAGGADNTADVIRELFRAMNTPLAKRQEEGIARWADGFPYVNGNLFAGGLDVPRFSRIARSYLIHIGNLDWTKINPDIFGSMIQAVADDEERGALGMHYTSVPNILKVLNPLFLDDLRAKLEEAGDNSRKLLNLRNRMAKIRVFDPACGSGNFLVIAYKAMREIEAEINKRRGEPDRKTEIPLTNFRGIELRDFPAEIARLALIIAEYQCDVLYRGQQFALAEFLPLNNENWITCGNALRLDWLSICPPTGTGVRVQGDDLFQTPLDQSEIDFENIGGETYICGNPPYVWSNDQTPEQKADIERIVGGRLKSSKSLNFVAGWFLKAVDHIARVGSKVALVSTNTICQGQSVPLLWPLLLNGDCEIIFAHTSFKWSNLAANNAGVTVVIVGLGRVGSAEKRLFWLDDNGELGVKSVQNISSYLIAGENVIVQNHTRTIDGRPELRFGNKPVDGGYLQFSRDTLAQAGIDPNDPMIKKIYGASEVINGVPKYCLWLNDDDVPKAVENDEIKRRINAVAELRKTSSDFGPKSDNHRPHQFREMRCGATATVALPSVSSENRDFLPVDLLDGKSVISNRNYGAFDSPIWVFSVLASRLHWMWAATVCGRLELRFSYTNGLGWNGFPLPKLLEQNKADLTRCAENILLAREAHFPATIADLYDPDTMPEDLRRAHEENDETLERIYIGRRFRNDTERLEKLFELYTKMTGKKAA